MKRVCALVFVLLLQCADRLNPPPRLFSPGIFGLEGFLLTAADPWYRFWRLDNGAFRMQMSEPADARLRAIYANVAGAARQKGYRFRDPELRQTRPELDAMMPDGVGYYLAVTYHGSDLMMVNRWWMERLDDHMLRSLVAHELGHAIDRQNQRTGHPTLDALPEDGDSEIVADIISLDMSDYEAYQARKRRTNEVFVTLLARRR